MAVKNDIYVYIDGINRTNKLIYPVKLSSLLDESLDEAVITLKFVKREIFPPLTPVEIRVINEVGWQGRVASREEKTYHYVIAGDSVTESPVGSGLYNHQLALVEVTKAAECIVVDTLTVTNDIGRVYTNNQKQVIPTVDNESNDYNWDGWDDY